MKPLKKGALGRVLTGTGLLEFVIGRSKHNMFIICKLEVLEYSIHIFSVHEVLLLVVSGLVLEGMSLSK